jgi:Xaa-Pro aminopeptidase
MTAQNLETAVVRGGASATNKWLYHRVRFAVGDPAAMIDLPKRNGRAESIFIVRDIEMERARRHARASRVAAPSEFAPAGGLSGDREVATAQAAAECLRRAGVKRVVGDRSLPLVFASEIERVGIAVECDADLGVLERRAKDDEEIAHLREAQRVTEDAVRLACEMVARSMAGRDGALAAGGAPLTSERVRGAIDVFLAEAGYDNPRAIVAGGRIGADCHDDGSGLLRTGEPVIIDVFPRNKRTFYNGDCTRTVVHGAIPPRVASMHAAVVAAKAKAIAAVRAGATGAAVHAATSSAIRAHGFEMGTPPAGAPDDWCGMVHGTGHGVGLDVHEPPLLDSAGGPLVAGDVLTIEPGLYSKAIGGVRVEDMVVVTKSGCENLDRLPEGLDWS